MGSLTKPLCSRTCKILGRRQDGSFQGLSCSFDLVTSNENRLGEDISMHLFRPLDSFINTIYLIFTQVCVCLLHLRLSNFSKKLILECSPNPMCQRVTQAWCCWEMVDLLSGDQMRGHCKCTLGKVSRAKKLLFLFFSHSWQRVGIHGDHFDPNLEVAKVSSLERE